MECLVVEFLIQMLVPFTRLPLFLVHLLESFKLIGLALRVVLQDADSLSHCLLGKHVVLHATLQNLLCFLPIRRDPASVSLRVHIGVRYLLHIHEDVVGWV